MIKDNNVQFLCAKIGGHWVGVDVKSVTEIASPGEKGLSKLSESTNCYTYNGQEIKAVHLSEVLLEDNVRYQTSNRVLISKCDSENIGLVVDSAEEIIRTSKEEIKPVDNLSDAGIKNNLLEGYLNLEDRIIHILSIERIFNTISKPVE